MFIDYTATREVIGSGLDEIECAAEIIDRPLVVEGDEAVSLSGVGREYTLDRVDYEWTMQTVPLLITSFEARFREFASSVANGEQFLFDPLGSKAVPNTVYTVSLIRNSYREIRDSSKYKRFAFRVVQR